MSMSSREKLLTLVVSIAACCVGNSLAIDDVEIHQLYSADNIRRKRVHPIRNVLHVKNGSRTLRNSSFSVIDLVDQGNSFSSSHPGETMSFEFSLSTTFDNPSNEEHNILPSSSPVTSGPTSRSTPGLLTTPSNPPPSDDQVTIRQNSHINSTHTSNNSTSSPTTRALTPSPSNNPTTNEPTGHPSSSKPTMSPSMQPTTASPSHSPTSLRPTTTKPSSQSPSSNPSNAPITMSPSMQPTTGSPSHSPTSLSAMTMIPSSQSPTSNPSNAPSTMSPSMQPITGSPSHSPTSLSPTTTIQSIQSPTYNPSDLPSTMSPSMQPITGSPSHTPTSLSPSTMIPSSQSPTYNPSDAPTTMLPSMQPITASPSHHPSSQTPSHKPTISPTALEISISNELNNDPTATPVTSSITATPIPSKFDEKFSNSPTKTVPRLPSMAPASISPVQSSTSNAPTTDLFSSKVRIIIDGVTELMDNETKVVLENATLSFLNEQFIGVLEVNEVNVLSQSVGSRNVRVLNGRRFSKIGSSVDKSALRSLAESSSPPALSVELSVDGIVSNWTALNEANDSGDSISTALSHEISSNYEEFMSELSDESDFFPSESPHTPSSVVSSSEASAANDKPNHKIVIIFGAVVAFVALVGSKIYMERKSGTKRRRPYDEDIKEEEFAYDLSRVTKSGDNLIGDESCPSAEKEDEEMATYDGGCACLEPMDMKVPKKEKVDARMTSLLDQVESVETEPQQNEVSALDLSPQHLKAAIKRKEKNIYVFTDNQAPKKNAKFPDDNMIEIQHSVSSLSNPSHIEEPFTPSPRYGYLGDRFNHTSVEKMIGDQYDTRAIMTPFTPKGNRSSTPSHRMNYSFSSPTSTPRKSASHQDKLYYVYAPSGPLGTIIDTTPEGPMIHSLKPNSQLLGLVDPGDLIVGLDGVDTRNMTAATFTRLMAKRSQGERKITLMKGSAPLSPTPSSPR